jgi:hypothetical protein
MGRQGRRTLTALGLTAALLMCGLVATMTGNAFGAGFLPPVNVSAGSASSPGACGFLGGHPGIGGIDVATNPRGDTIVAWARNDGAGAYTVQASFRPAGGSFGPPQDIGSTLTCFFLSVFGPTPDVALDANGGAVIVFGAPGPGGNTVARAALMPPGGTFGTPVDLSDDTNSASVPMLAMNSSGMAVAVWSWDSGVNDIIQTATRQPGQQFGLATPLTFAGADAGSPRVSVNDNGATAAAWVRSDGTVDLAQARVRPAGAAAFAAPQDLSVTGAVGQDASNPDVAIDPAGRTTVVWVHDDGAETRVQSRVLSPEGVAGAGIDDVSDPGENGSSPDLALDPGNNAVVVFGACPIPAGDNCAVKSAARPSGGSFGSVAAISAAGENSLSPKVVMDGSGTATAVFSPFINDARILVTRRPVGGSFGAVQPVSPTGGSALAPDVAVDGEGNVLTAWTFVANAGAHPYVAQAAAYDAAAPTLAAVSVPSAGTAGQGVGMAAAATDRWSPVSVTWNFGDGTSGTGGAVTHAFGAAGAFNVTVTATDGAGNAAGATRPIVISPAPPPPKKRITSKVRVTWGVSGRKIFLLRLSAGNVPKGGKLELRCKGKKCPFKRRSSKKRRGGSITLFKEIKAAKVAGKNARRFRAKQTLQVRITAPTYIGKVVRYKLKKGKIPSGKTLCLPVGAKKPRSRCP